MPIELRPAKREELERVNELRRAVNAVHVQGRPDIFKPGFCAELAGRVYEQFESEAFDVIVAVMDGEICGFATVQYIYKPESPFHTPHAYSHVDEFCVDAACRRRGVGRALVDYLRADARARGLARLDLDAWAFNRDALAFYEAAGFTPYRIYLETDTGLEETPRN